MTNQNDFTENFTYQLSSEILRDVAYAYFTVSTREKIDYEIILIREGINSLPFIMEQTLCSFDRARQIRVIAQDELWRNENRPNNDEEKWLDYMNAKVTLDDILKEAYEVCRRFGDQLERQLIMMLDHSDSRTQLLCLILLYKLDKLSVYSVQKIKDFVINNNQHKLSSLYEQIGLLVIYRSGDHDIREYVERQSQKMGTSAENVIENTYFGILVELSRDKHE